ncbi:MAG: prepilin-type N-terminal cleavage/methylation domain-containing protein [Candidatus Omnitrophota bacterium]|nr:prepilin-type N-terminal cleavage/methylation domain-containing protein [Candidatus Omnitrophota bacterium]
MQHNKKGVTLLEILIAVLLMSVIFLAVSSLYLAARRFYITARDKAVISSEAQYAIQHIYKYAMQAMGDKNTAPFTVTANQLDIRIYTGAADPITSTAYGNSSNYTSYSYTYNDTDKKLYFQEGSGSPQDLMEKVSVTGLTLNKIESGTVTTAFTGSITASYNGQSQIFYFSCYPRFASFH